MPDETKSKPRTRAKRRDYRAELESIATYCATMAAAYTKIAESDAVRDLNSGMFKGAIEAYLDISARIRV